MFLFSAGCNHTTPNQEALIIFNAGSLSVPFKEISEAFEKKYPGTSVLLEAAGSRECARKITELNKPCDIIASSDYSVISDLLLPEYADWYVSFAGNEMCIVYTDNSRKEKEINDNNWYDILQDNSVIYGRSDPNLDPCGYRTIMVYELAEKYYHQPGLMNKLLQKDEKYIRPKEVDLLSLLESNSIDYAFIYKSVAVQHGLKYIPLPDSINLGNPTYADFYTTAEVEVSGKSPGEKITKTGEPMVYAFTILKNAPHSESR